MLMITRTEGLIELGHGDKRLMAFDAAAIDNAMLCAERAPCGAIRHVLALTFSNGAEPVRLEGRVIELCEVHQVVMEVMGETARRCVN